MKAGGAGGRKNGLLHGGLDSGLHLRIVLPGADDLLACRLTGTMGHRTALLGKRTIHPLTRPLGSRLLPLSSLPLCRSLALGRGVGTGLRCGCTGGRLVMGSGIRVLGGHALTPPALLILLALSYISAQNSSSTDPLPES